MRKFFIFCGIIYSFCASAQLKWLSIQEAIDLQKEKPKKIIMSFVANDCKSCKELEEKSFKHPALSQYISEHYYLVKFNTDTTQDVFAFDRIFKANPTKNKHEFTTFMNINTVPSIVFLDEKSNFIILIQGKISPQEFEPYVLFMNSKDYHKVSDKRTWESYMSSFKPRLTK